MPQLLPFYFVDALTSTLILLGLIIWLLTQVVLPIFPRLQISRLYVSAL